MLPEILILQLEGEQMRMVRKMFSVSFQVFGNPWCNDIDILNPAMFLNSNDYHIK